MKGSLNKKILIPDEKICLLNEKMVFSQGSILGAWNDCGFIQNRSIPKFPDL